MAVLRVSVTAYLHTCVSESVFAYLSFRVSDLWGLCPCERVHDAGAPGSPGAYVHEASIAFCVNLPVT